MVRGFPGQFSRQTFLDEKESVVSAAIKTLDELTRQELHKRELQGAQICALLHNINRDPSKGKSVGIEDYLLMKPAKKARGDLIPAAVAHACLALRHEERLPKLLLGVWPDVLAGAKEQAAETVEFRALVSEDKNVVVLAPAWEHQNIRGFLAVKNHRRGELVELQDIDRPMLKFVVQMPLDIQAVHYEAGALLLTPANLGRQI